MEKINMVASLTLRDDVERWLIHGNYAHRETATKESFKFILKNVGIFGSIVEIFEPKKQPGVLVIGAKTELKNNQNARYIRFNDAQKESFEARVADYCRLLMTVHRFTEENGKKVIGTYIVLDKKDEINQAAVLDALVKSGENGDKITQYLMRTL